MNCNILDRGLEGVLSWAKNTVQDGSSNYYNGCFMSAEFSQWWSSSSGFQNKWFTGHDTSQNREVDIGGQTTTDAELMIGVSYNTLYGAATQVGDPPVTVGDYLQLKT